MTAVDLTQLTTLFSGGQLVIIVFLLMEIRSVKDATRVLTAQSAERDSKIAKIDKKLAHVMGRLNIASDDDGD
jgi:hypothetical protein